MSPGTEPVFQITLFFVQLYFFLKIFIALEPAAIQGLLRMYSVQYLTMLFQLTSGDYMVFQLFQNVQFQNPLQWSPCSLGQNYLYKICNKKKKKIETPSYK